MEFDVIVKKRKSARAFSKKKVSWKNILEAVDAALQGPFAGNQNNLRFLIVEKQETIKAIAKLCEQEWISQAQTLILVLSNDINLENMYGERGRIYSRQQAGAAIQTILLKLTELGLGSCWVGAYSDELLKSKLEIPQHIQIEAVIPVGYSDEKTPKKNKKELENALYWERWEQIRRPTNFEPVRHDYHPGRYD
jgi:nitroreductase